MEFFALLQMHLATCGIKTSQKPHPFNVKNFTIIIAMCVSVIVTALSLNEANTFDECTDTMFRVSSIGTCGILYVIIVWKTSKLSEFIDSLSDTIELSKFMKDSISKSSKNNF